MAYSLTELNEFAVVTWINDFATHGYPVGITPRLYKTVKFDGVTFNPVELPAVIVKATQLGMVHTQVAVWKFDIEVCLIMQADDTTQAAWDTAANALEWIFTVDDLAGYLTLAAPSYLCRGILYRNTGQTREEDRHWKRDYQIQLWASRNY